MDGDHAKRDGLAISTRQFERDDSEDRFGVPISPSTTVASSSEGEKKPGLFKSLRNRATRRFSTQSNPASPVNGTPPYEAPTADLVSRRLQKHHSRSSSAFESFASRRTSGRPESTAYTATSLTASSAGSVDWKLQRLEGYAALEPESQVFRNRSPYLCVTSDYIIKVRDQQDFTALFPHSDGSGVSATGTPAPEPLLVVPIYTIVSVFHSEGTRPSFGIEVWWRSLGNTAFRSTVFYLPLPAERDSLMRAIFKVIKQSTPDGTDKPRYSDFLVDGPIRKLYIAEEPNYKHHSLEIFPVVPRGATRKKSSGVSEEKFNKVQGNNSFYFAIGANVCLFVQISSTSTKGGEPQTKCAKFGLVTLESIKADWAPRHERFNITFRDPFKPPITLELASRYYRQIIRVLAKAYRYLKPAYPPLSQSLEIFHVSQLPPTEYVPALREHGGLERTLEAYVAAYRCRPVEWEVNWKTPFSPEFRLLPPRDGLGYNRLQLLAVLRALRYNTYFSSLSFTGVDLTELLNCRETSLKSGSVAYMNCYGARLSDEELHALRFASVLHQEFHALAFGSGTIQQMNLSETITRFPKTPLPSNETRTLEYLAPILKLLHPSAEEVDMTFTPCRNLILSGNTFTTTDLDDIVTTLRTGAILGLDMSHCGLSSMGLRDIIEAVSYRGETLRSLKISGNAGRVSAYLVTRLLETTRDLQELDLSETLSGPADGDAPLFTFAHLDRLDQLTELDISGFKVQESTISALEHFFLRRADCLARSNVAVPFRRLVLNNCNVTGSEAARLFKAMGNRSGVQQVHLNCNPLDDGVEKLGWELCNSYGPSVLHMEMIEFRTEASYAVLMESLTSNTALVYLNLAGTSPTTSTDGLSKATCRAMEDFFKFNKSLRFLDLSGYKGKLDDGQLGAGFGKALRGLRENKTLTHLRIRGQNLHSEVGVLGEILTTNQTLRMLDIQDNNFNMTSLQHLCNSIQKNDSIVEFQLSAPETERIWQNILADLRKSASTASSKSAKETLQAQERALRPALDRCLDDIQKYIHRNMGRLDIPPGQMLDQDDSSETGFQEGWPRLEVFSPHHEAEILHSPPFEAETEHLRRPTLRYSGFSVDMSSNPYHATQDEGMESPTDTASPLSIPTTPEATSPSASGDIPWEPMFQSTSKVMLTYE